MGGAVLGTGVDHDARIEDLFRKHAAGVLAYAMRRGASRAEAEDVLAETFLIAWRRSHQIPPEELPWLLGVARNVLSNNARSKRRYTALIARVIGTAPTYDARSDPSELVGLSGDVRQALMELSETDREALLLVAWEGLTHGEAAEVLSLSRKGFSRRVSRARSRLLRLLEDIRT